MSNQNQEKATLAGGCFWCTEAIFKRLKGVESVVSGYTGGTLENPTSTRVSTGTTGHAEAIQIAFDPTVISYADILEVFFHTHNPTTLNQQGADTGTQYRSAIFYHDENQLKSAKKIKHSIESSGQYKDPIVTEIVKFEKFYPAEEYHQNFHEKYSFEPYCQIVIDPKIKKLLAEFPRHMKS